MLRWLIEIQLVGLLAAVVVASLHVFSPCVWPAGSTEGLAGR
jgi:hypothetical protein